MGIYRAGGCGCGRHPLPCPAGEGAPGAGWLRPARWGVRSPLNFVHVSENCFGRKGRCRISAIEGEKPGRRRLPWASGKDYWTAGQMGEGWRPRGDSLWLAGNFKRCSKVDSVMSNLLSRFNQNESVGPALSESRVPRGGQGREEPPEPLRSFRRVLLCGEDVTRFMLPLKILYGAESLLYRYLKLK